MMKKLITTAQIFIILAIVSTLAFGEQIIQATEAMVGANHPTLADTINRGFLIQHDAEGVHAVVPYSVLTGVPTTFPWDNLTGTPTTLAGYGITDNLSALISLPWDNVTSRPTTIAGYGITDSMVQDNVAITGGSITGTTITLNDNSVAPVKLQYDEGTADNTTFYRGDGKWMSPSVSFQDQIDAKQGLDADLTVLATPAAWRVFYSNGSQAITELALEASGTYLKSNGVSSAPTFSTVTAVGNADTATALAANGSNCPAGQSPLGIDASGAVEGCWTPTASLDNATMDNTIIGGTTPVAGTFTILTSDNVAITGGTIDNTSIDNSIIGGTNPTISSFTLLNNSGVHTSSGGSTFPDDTSAAFGTGSNFGCKFNSTSQNMICATDNGVSLSDTDPMYIFRTGVATATDNGQEVLAIEDNTTKLWKITKEGNSAQTGTHTATQFITDCAAADNNCYVNALAESTTGAEATLGNCLYDNTTKGWLCYNGSAWAASTATSVHWDNVTNKTALPQVKDFIIKGYSTDDNTMLLWKADQAQTLTRLDCMTGGTDNVTITLYECASDGGTCATTGLVAAATSAGAVDSSASNGSIDADDWVRVYVESIQGTATYVSCSARYTVAMP